jgi:hypothetical protein
MPTTRIITALGAGAIAVALALSVPVAAFAQERHPQTTWAPIGRKPLSDRAAAALVTHVPEVRAENVRANNYRPTDADLRYFRSVKNPAGQTSVALNSWNAYVNGRSYLKNPSTDDLIQWAAHKWGIPEDWLRAQLAWESWWQMDLPGDLARVSDKWYNQYAPLFHSKDGQNLVYESAGLSQIKWTPDNAVNVGTRFLRYRSSAFDLDYMGAESRYYYDGKCNWCRPHYHAGNPWLSIAAWNSPAPWNNVRQRQYASNVRRTLQQRPWTLPSFPTTRFHRP